MRVPRFFLDGALAPGEARTLEPGATHHALRVLRLRTGDAVTVFNGLGGEHAARVADAQRDALLIEIGEWRDVEREAPIPVLVAQGVSSADRMDLTVQKAVELGAAVLQPLDAARSVVRLDARRVQTKLEHWRRIARAACEQCGRNRLPEVRAPRSVAEFCAGLSGIDARWLLAPGAAQRLRTLVQTPPQRVALAAGPEAGFTEAELRAFEAAGFVPVQLGPRVLRTETAALAALAALNALAGDA